MTVQRELVRKLLGQMEPFEGAVDLSRADAQGWGSDHPYLTRAIDELRPSLIVEVGVWKGGSVMTMANRLRELGLDGAVIAIDTWLGAYEHWLTGDWLSHLAFERGYPTIFQTFRANIVAANLQDYVVPMPLDSINAGHVLRHHGMQADVIHIDGAHDYQAVLADLQQWWSLLRPGGVLIGDDYHPSGPVWPGVRQAFNEFFQTDALENSGGKCWISKAADQ